MNKKFYIIISIIIFILAILSILFFEKLSDQNQKLKDEVKALKSDNIKKEESISALNNELANLKEETEEDNESTEKEKGEDSNVQDDEDNLSPKLKSDLYYDDVKNLDEKVFLKDFESYKPESNKVKIAEKEAKKIAEKGFEESKRRIAGEGVDNKESEWVQIEEVYANNYFTRLHEEGDKVYQNIKRKCYVFRRENDMGCGVSIYVDVTTGLIIGGNAFGD